MVERGGALPLRITAHEHTEHSTVKLTRAEIIQLRLDAASRAAGVTGTPTLNYDAHGVCQCETTAPHAVPLQHGILIALTHCQAENVETAINEYLRLAASDTETDARRTANHALTLIHDVIAGMLDNDYHDSDYHEPIARASVELEQPQ